MIVGELYYSLNSGRIYRYDEEVKGQHSLVIIKPGPNEPEYMKGRCLEYRGLCPLMLIPATKDHWK